VILFLEGKVDSLVMQKTAHRVSRIKIMDTKGVTKRIIKRVILRGSTVNNKVKDRRETWEVRSGGGHERYTFLTDGRERKSKWPAGFWFLWKKRIRRISLFTGKG